jgi:glycosyltransferase involved in cell wall biosynthesis
MNTNSKADATKSPIVSVIIPCMNEEKTIGRCIEKARASMAEQGLSGEIIVADNSTDNSKEIAKSLGAKVVTPPGKGYGIAYLEGFRHATGQYILMVDADDTYDMSEIPGLIAPLISNTADFVIGNRLKGNIKKGSMPFLHRYIGNPVLTGTLNWLFKIRIGDAHCGMRAITKEAFEKLDLKSEGMEFASEMIIEAARKKLRITEVPISYYPRLTPSKLHSWGDGWRHMRFMMLYNPIPFFYLPGLLLFILGAFMVFTLSMKGNVETTSLHSFILGSMLAIIGTQMTSTGIFMKAYGIISGKIEKKGLTARILDYHSLEMGLLVGAIIFFAGMVLGMNVLLTWISSGYGSLSEVGRAVVSMVLAALGIQIIFSSLIISIFMLGKKGK